MSVTAKRSKKGMAGHGLAAFVTRFHLLANDAHKPASAQGGGKL